MDADFRATKAAEVLLGLVRASAIEAISLLAIDPLDLETLMEVIPRSSFVSVDPLATRARMNVAAWLSLLNTAGTELPPRSRITTTTLRLPFWFLANRRSGRCSF